MSRSLRLAGLLCLAIPALAAGQASRPSPAKDATRPAGPPASGTAGKPAGAEGQHEGEGRTLEERVSDLKEKIFRTKARLMNLQEMVVGGDPSSGPRAVLVHRNEMGSKFYLESIAYALDGAPIYAKEDVDGDLEKRPEFEIFSGRVVPGAHQLSVQLVYRGHGYGVFRYVEGYKFKVRSSYTFNAEAGKVSTIKVVGFEKGGVTAELQDRPAVRYDVEVQREEATRKAATPPAAEGTKR